MKRFDEFLAKWRASLKPMGEYTPRAQQVFALARKEADRFGRNYIGTEHLLMGLIKLGQGVAVNVLNNQGLNLENIRMEIEREVGKDPGKAETGRIPFTPRMKRVIENAKGEVKALGHRCVGTEHLLLGLLSEREGLAARVFQKFNVDIEKTRKEVLKELGNVFSPDDNPSNDWGK